MQPQYAAGTAITARLSREQTRSTSGWNPLSTTGSGRSGSNDAAASSSSTADRRTVRRSVCARSRRHRRISLLHHQGRSWAEIGAFVGQRKLSLTSDVYTHVLTDGREVDVSNLLGTVHASHAHSVRA